MKESWRYYDFLRRWGLLLLLGLVLGALGGFSIHLQQDHPPLFIAKALVIISTNDRPGVWLPRANFNVTSAEYPDPKRSVRNIIDSTEWLDAQPGYRVSVEDLSIEPRHASPLWKTILLGSFIGGLLVIGGAYVWDDARAYVRHRQETDSEDV